MEAKLQKNLLDRALGRSLPLHGHVHYSVLRPTNSLGGRHGQSILYIIIGMPVQIFTAKVW
jgi:hypothetical protein